MLRVVSWVNEDALAAYIPVSRIEDVVHVIVAAIQMRVYFTYDMNVPFSLTIALPHQLRLKMEI